jgi:hypothetical protein
VPAVTVDDGQHVAEVAAKRDPSTRIRHQWAIPVALRISTLVLLPLGIALNVNGLTIPGVICGILTFVLANDYFFVSENGKQWIGRTDPTRDRVKKLRTALAESIRVIEAIRSEVESNQQLVERLQADVETHKELLALHQSEVEAVAQVVAGEVRREGRRGLYASIVLNALFFGLRRPRHAASHLDRRTNRRTAHAAGTLRGFDSRRLHSPITNAPQSLVRGGR